MAMNNTAHSTEIWHDYQRMLLPMALGSSMGGFYVTASGSLIATLSRDHGLKPEDFAALGSAFGMAMLISGLIAPWMLRFGPVWPLRLTPFLVVTGTVLLSWSPGVLVSLLGAVLACLGGALMSTAGAATFTGTRGSKYLALMVGTASLVSILTTVLFALVEHMAPGHGRMTIWFVLLAVVPSALAGWRLPAVPFRQFMRSHPEPASNPDTASQSAQSPHELAASPANSGTSPANLDPNLANSTVNSDSITSRPAADEKVSPVLFFWQVLRLILLAGVEFAVYAWAVTRFEQMGVALASASGLATGFAVGMAVGRFAGANFTHRYSAWYVTVGLGACGTALAAYVPSVWVATVGFCIAGLGVSCLYPISTAEFTSLPGLVPHRAAAIISLLSGAGALLTPVLLGVLLSAVGLQAGFAVLLGFYALLAILPRPPLFVKPASKRGTS